MRDQQGSYTKINRLNIERFWTTRSALLPKSTRIRRGRQNDALKNGLFEAHQGLPPTAALRAVMAHAPAAPDGALRALGARCARVFCFLGKYRMCAALFTATRCQAQQHNEHPPGGLRSARLSPASSYDLTPRRSPSALTLSQCFSHAL